MRTALRVHQYPFAQYLINQGVEKPGFDPRTHTLFDAHFTHIDAQCYRGLHEDNSGLTTFQLDYLRDRVPALAKVANEVDQQDVARPTWVWLQLLRAMARHAASDCPHMTTGLRFSAAAFGQCPACTQTKAQLISKYRHLKRHSIDGWRQACKHPIVPSTAIFQPLFTPSTPNSSISFAVASCTLGCDDF